MTELLKVSSDISSLMSIAPNWFLTTDIEFENWSANSGTHNTGTWYNTPCIFCLFPHWQIKRDIIPLPKISSTGKFAELNVWSLMKLDGNFCPTTQNPSFCSDSKMSFPTVWLIFFSLLLYATSSKTTITTRLFPHFSTNSVKCCGSLREVLKLSEAMLTEFGGAKLGKESAGWSFTRYRLVMLSRSVKLLTPASSRYPVNRDNILGTTCHAK